MNKYELMLISSPSQTDEERKATMAELKDLLSANSANIISEEIWGEKKMAYKINGTLKWYYVLFNIKIDWTKLKEINKSMNLIKNIWRYMFVKLEK